METIKTTFTLDLPTVRRIKQAAANTGLSKSAVVREAIQEYGERRDRLSAKERIEMLQVINEELPEVPERPQSEIDAEKAEIRESRRVFAARDRERDPVPVS